MKFKDTLENLLAQKSKVKILRFLLKTRLESMGREIARAIKMDHKTCHRALKELAQQGVILLNNTNSGVLYKINDKNLLVKELLAPLFERENRLIELMALSLTKRIKTPFISVVLFGSVAGGKERAASDVDILIVASNKKRKKEIENALSLLEFDFIHQFGNMLSPVVLSLDNFRSRLRKRDPFLLGVLRIGAPIAGKSPQELIKIGSKKHST
ncbi:MAG: nucleotidyltransferase domain-containing protein [Candidatus Saganbacteria bacterium]|nr:nucleotidyltransferase domain-containing protein [Candidatus Saganbacteria bacterium]